MDFSHQTVLVTGGSRGIGFEIARMFVQAKARVVLCSTTQHGCDQAVEQLKPGAANTIVGISANISVANECKKLVQQANEAVGTIDILINNAGITCDNLLVRLSESNWETVINTNLNGVFYLTKYILKPMIKKRSGRIINISSVVGIHGNKGQTNYAASKAGVIGMTKSLAKEVGPKGITCNVVAPGFIETDMMKSLPKDYIDTIIGSVAMRRLGSTTDVAHTVMFLASSMANYITGQVVSVDGGMN